MLTSFSGWEKPNLFSFEPLCHTTNNSIKYLRNIRMHSKRHHSIDEKNLCRYTGRLRHFELRIIFLLKFRCQGKLSFSQMGGRGWVVDNLIVTKQETFCLYSTVDFGNRGKKIITVELKYICLRFTLLKSSIGGLCWALFSVWKLNSCSEVKTWYYWRQ